MGWQKEGFWVGMHRCSCLWWLGGHTMQWVFALPRLRCVMCDPLRVGEGVC